MLCTFTKVIQLQSAVAARAVRGFSTRFAIRQPILVRSFSQKRPSDDFSQNDWQDLQHVHQRNNTNQPDYGGMDEINHRAARERDAIPGRTSADESAAEAMQGFDRSVVEEAEDVAERAKTAVKEGGQSAWNAAKGATQDVRSKASDWVNDGKDKVQQTWSEAEAAAEQGWASAQDMGRRAASGVKHSMSDAADDVKTKAKQYVDKAKDIGEDVKAGMQDLGDQAQEAVGDFEERDFDFNTHENHKPAKEHPLGEMRHAAEHFTEGIKKAAHRDWSHEGTSEHEPGAGGAAEELEEAAEHMKSGTKGVVDKVKRWITNKQ